MAGFARISFFGIVRGSSSQRFSTSASRFERKRVQAVALRSTKAPKGSEDGNRKPFVDWQLSVVKGGNGGDGHVSFSSVFGEEFNGPDGGCGGNGGHVIFKATKVVSSLGHLSRRIGAVGGVPGRTTDRDGKDAPNRVIAVPLGTVFRNSKTRDVVAQLTAEGDLFLAAKGGSGGKGNAFFKTSLNQTPRIAEAGGQGEQFELEVELQTMAHFGLLGFPNAGKSTLLRAISRARPRVAAYPFTTLKPNVGVVSYDDGVQIAVADLPGLIEDAHKNRGLGIGFLRHVERCLCLLFVVDMSQDDPVGQFETLKAELTRYREDLPAKSQAIVANKMDVPSSKENLKRFAAELGGGEESLRLLPISGKFGTNVGSVLQFMREAYDSSEAARREKGARATDL